MRTIHQGKKREVKLKKGCWERGVEKFKNQETSSHTDLFLEKVYMNVDNLETTYLSIPA